MLKQVCLPCLPSWAAGNVISSAGVTQVRQWRHHKPGGHIIQICVHFSIIYIPFVRKGHQSQESEKLKKARLLIEVLRYTTLSDSHTQDPHQKLVYSPLAGILEEIFWIMTELEPWYKRLSHTTISRHIMQLCDTTWELTGKTLSDHWRGWHRCPQMFMWQSPTHGSLTVMFCVPYYGAETKPHSWTYCRKHRRHTGMIWHLLWSACNCRYGQYSELCEHYISFMAY